MYVTHTTIVDVPTIQLGDDDDFMEEPIIQQGDVNRIEAPIIQPGNNTDVVNVSTIKSGDDDDFADVPTIQPGGNDGFTEEPKIK